MRIVLERGDATRVCAPQLKKKKKKKKKTSVFPFDLDLLLFSLTPFSPPPLAHTIYFPPFSTNKHHR